MAYQAMIWEAHRLGGTTSGLSHAMIWEAHRLGGTTSGLSSYDLGGASLGRHY